MQISFYHHPTSPHPPNSRTIFCSITILNHCPSSSRSIFYVFRVAPHVSLFCLGLFQYVVVAVAVAVALSYRQAKRGTDDRGAEIHLISTNERDISVNHCLSSYLVRVTQTGGRSNMAYPSSSSPTPSSSSHPILCASFNQDTSCIAIGTKDGFKIFNCHTGRLCYERAIGAFVIVEMLYSSSLLAIVGAGEQPSLSPRRLCLFNTTASTALRELNFLTSVVAVRLNRKRLVVILQDKTYIYDSNSLAILDTIDTLPNPKGLCAFSPSLDGCFLALPASITQGSVLLYNVMELNSHCEIHAHQAPLAAMVLSSNGKYIATASEQGTMVRVHLVSEATKSFSFRRGSYPSTIFSLSFGPSTELPDILLATSSSGSVHVFSLGCTTNRRSRRSTSFLSSIMPKSVNEVLDPVHHHVLHDAVPVGVKSYAIIHSVSKAAAIACRATIYIITFTGCFLEYCLSINEQNESFWSLEREFNLLQAISDNVTNSRT